MRVRPQRQASRRRLGLRRPHGPSGPATGAPETAAPPTPEGADDTGSPPPAAAEGHADERRHRASVAPEDHALYRCECGYQFEADVSASVACPHCGASQAW